MREGSPESTSSLWWKVYVKKVRFQKIAQVNVFEEWSQ